MPRIGQVCKSLMITRRSPLFPNSKPKLSPGQRLLLTAVFLAPLAPSLSSCKKQPDTAKPGTNKSAPLQTIEEFFEEMKTEIREAKETRQRQWDSFAYSVGIHNFSTRLECLRMQKTMLSRISQLHPEMANLISLQKVIDGYIDQYPRDFDFKKLSSDEIKRIANRLYVQLAIIDEHLDICHFQKISLSSIPWEIRTRIQETLDNHVSVTELDIQHFDKINPTEGTLYILEQIKEEITFLAQ